LFPAGWVCIVGLNFLANISHELRNPLGALLGFSELLSLPDLSEEKRVKYIAAIKKNAELLSGIFDDILDLSKVEAGKLQVEKCEVNIADLLSDLNILLSLRAKESSIAFNVRISPDVPKFVKTDPIRLKQILMNIAGNALKFTQEGNVSLVVKLLKHHPVSKIAFIIEDTGIGISEDQAKHLFEPFAQADDTIGKNFGGTGLGLAISKHLANLLDGDIELTTSKPHRGSVFTITIPVDVVKKMPLPKRFDDRLQLHNLI